MSVRTPSDKRSATIPLPRSSLVGRAHDIAEIRRLLIDDNVPLVTLVGTAGVGKTRLALHAGQALAPSFADGVCLMRLETIGDPDQVLANLGQTLGVRESLFQPLDEAIIAYLRSKQMLLLLDSFEHVTAAATDVRHILEQCPAVQVLATSRVALRIDGEHILGVPPLATPRTPHRNALEDLGRVEAVELFVRRARAVDRGFVFDEGNAEAISTLCKALDGLPLAIELAASRARLLSPRQMLSLGLGQIGRFGDNSDAGQDRHGTMGSAIDWSYRLLTPEAQRAFRWLSVFNGGFRLDVATQVLAAAESALRPSGEQAANALTLIESLVDHSLVYLIDRIDDEPRFAMLEPIREYAAWQLARLGEVKAARSAHAGSYAAIAAQVPVAYFAEPGGSAQSRLTSDYANVRAAMMWLLEERADPSGAELVASMCGYWLKHCLWGEARQWIERALTLDAPSLGALRPRLTSWLSIFASQSGDHLEAVRLGRLQLELARSNPSIADRARALLTLAATLGPVGEFEESARLGRESLALAEEAAEPQLEVNARNLIGWTDLATDDFDSAVRTFEAAVVVARRLGSSDLLVVSLCGLGASLRHIGRRDEARAHLEEALEVSGSIGDEYGVAIGLSHLAWLAADESRYHDCARMHGKALEIYRRSLGAYWVGAEFIGLAYVAAQSADFPSAAVLLGVEAAIREQARYRFPNMIRDRQSSAHDLACQALGAEAFSRSWSMGMRMSWDAALDIAIALCERSSDPSSNPSPLKRSRVDSSGGELSEREKEVLRLLERRLSDKEIAAQLFVSVRTVHAHVRSVLGKLGVSSRREAAMVAARRGMLSE